MCRQVYQNVYTYKVPLFNMFFHTQHVHQILYFFQSVYPLRNIYQIIVKSLFNCFNVLT